MKSQTVNSTQKARRKEPAAAEPPTHSTKARVLVVEDEQDLQDLIRFNLERNGYRVTCAESGEKALRLVRSELPDLIVLDLMLPGMDGLQFCRAMKEDAESAEVPIIMLTAKSEEADIVAGLELGADDYVTKPFSPRVLLARIKAVLRRGDAVADTETVSGRDVHLRQLTIRPERHEVLVNDQPVDLTATEFRLLTLLAVRPGRVFTRQQIIEQIHGKFAAVTDRSVDVQVVALRRKLGEVGVDLQTVRGVGYRYRE